MSTVSTLSLRLFSSPARFSSRVLSVWRWLVSGGFRTLVKWAGVVFTAVFLGLLTVFFPAGLVVRVVVIAAAVAVIAFAWALRSEQSGEPGQLVLGMLLAAVVLSVLWPRYIFFPLGPISVNPQSLLVLACVMVGLTWLIYSPRLSNKFWRLPLFHGWLGGLLLAWFCWRYLTAFAGDYPLQSAMLVIRDTAYVSSFILIAALILCFEQGERWICRVLLVAGLLAACYGLVEAVVQRNPLVRFASGGDSDAVADAIRSLTIEKVRGGKYRAQSVFSHPIVFSQFVAALIPFSFAVFIGEGKSFWRWVALVTVPIAMASLYATGSRSGVVALAASVGLSLSIVWIHAMGSRGYGRVVALLAAPLLCVALGLMYWIAQEVTLGRTATEAGSTAARLVMLKLGVEALSQSPFIGFGEGMAVMKAGLTDSSGHASIDSLLLSIAIETGYIGAFLFAGLFACYAARGFFLAARVHGREGVRVGLLTASAVAIMAVFLGLSISHNLTLLWIVMVIGTHRMAMLEKEA